MPNISVNISELCQLLENTPATHNIMLVGNHGIGKSQILTEFFEQKGMSVISLFLGQMSDPGDLIGLPYHDKENNKTNFLPPYWFPSDGKPIVLFLDELNRARPEILQTIMDLALNRKLAGKPLPNGSRLISAVNEGAQYQLTDLDPALVSRFNIVDFKPSVEEWLIWAKKNNIDNRIIDFISENKLWLDRDPNSKEGEDSGLDKNPDRRAWVRVSDITKGTSSISEVMKKIIASIVGAKAASEFSEYLINSKLITGKEIIMSFSSKKEKIIQRLEKYQVHQFAVVNEGIFRHIEVEKVKDDDISIVYNNLLCYFDFLTKNRPEAAAHFANMFIQSTYPNAVNFIALKCSTLVEKFVDYINNI